MGFSIPSYRKAQMKFLANPIEWELELMPGQIQATRKSEMEGSQVGGKQSKMVCKRIKQTWGRTLRIRKIGEGEEDGNRERQVQRNGETQEWICLSPASVSKRLEYPLFIKGVSISY